MGILCECEVGMADTGSKNHLQMYLKESVINYVTCTISTRY